MKLTVMRTTEIEATHLLLDLPVYYGDEDMPMDFPLRVGDRWVAKINLDTLQVEGWPVGRAGSFSMKVTDGGAYQLLNGHESLAVISHDYVPAFIPGDYGDYVDLSIGADGKVSNWPRMTAANVAKAFFSNEQD